MPKVKNAKRKVQITFRIEPDTAERLKKINKYHSKISAFIDYAMDDYESWLNQRNERRKNTINKNINKNEDVQNNKELVESAKKYFEDEDTRKKFIEGLKDKTKQLENHRFYGLDDDIPFDEIEHMESLIDKLENFDKLKL